MAPNLKDEEMQSLATEIAALTGESEAEAARQALRERRDRLELLSPGARRKPEGGLIHYLETEIWPQIPADKLGGPPISKAEKEELLGYGPEGY